MCIIQIQIDYWFSNISNETEQEKNRTSLKYLELKSVFKKKKNK